MKWIAIAEQAPPQDWPMFVKGTDADGFEVLAVLQWYKPGQEGYPGYFSPACRCDHDELDIEPTHWCDPGLVGLEHDRLQGFITYEPSDGAASLNGVE